MVLSLCNYIVSIIIYLDFLPHASITPYWFQEIKLLSELKHPNIVQYYDSEIVSILLVCMFRHSEHFTAVSLWQCMKLMLCMQVNGWFRIYLKYVPGGSIKKYIKDNGAIPESDVRRFTTHILSGLNYLHSENIVHRCNSRLI